MNINEMILLFKAIQAKYGDINVMIGDREARILDVENVTLRVAEDGEFPSSWNMPEGFTFVEISE